MIRMIYKTSESGNQVDRQNHTTMCGRLNATEIVYNCQRSREDGGIMHKFVEIRGAINNRVRKCRSIYVCVLVFCVRKKNRRACEMGIFDERVVGRLPSSLNPHSAPSYITLKQYFNCITLLW